MIILVVLSAVSDMIALRSANVAGVTNPTVKFNRSERGHLCDIMQTLISLKSADMQLSFCGRQYYEYAIIIILISG